MTTTEVKSANEAIKDDYNWQEVFAYAGGGGHGSANVSAAAGDGANVEPFGVDDVVEIIGSVEGENEVANWLIAGKLRDGRWFFLSAGCDYTGWDCQASGYAIVASTREHLIRYGIGDAERSELGLAPAAAPEGQVLTTYCGMCGGVVNNNVCSVCGSSAK